MPDITRAQLEERRARYMQLAGDYSRQVAALEGAVQAIDELIAELFPADALTIQDLGRALGAAEIGEPERLEAK